MDKQQEIIEFVQWLPQNIEQFSEEIPENIIGTIKNAKDEKEVVEILNQLTKNESGKQVVKILFDSFLESNTQMFKRGGKLEYGLRKLQNGGKQLYPEDIDRKPWTYIKKKDNPNQTTEYSSHTGWLDKGQSDWGTTLRERVIRINPENNVSDTLYWEKLPDSIYHMRVGTSTRNRMHPSYRWLFRAPNQETVNFWNNLEKLNSK